MMTDSPGQGHADVGADDTTSVTVAFLGSASPALRRHPLNTLAALLAPRKPQDPDAYVHCELLFPDNGEALSIVHNGTVQLAPKNFTRSGWTYRSVPCTRQQLSTMRSFAHAAVGDGFNTTGYWSPCGIGTKPLGHSMTDPSNRAGLRRRWYCSELTSECLASCGLVQELGLPRAVHLHPHALWQSLVDSDATSASAPSHKLDLIDVSIQ
ncbi:MAG: hypothetical protein CL484_07410 [Acidobacteria bacterium]|nr:hypothetical protein [Acidobacteriota bacterium]